MRKITISLLSKKYDITLDDGEFADHFERELKDLLGNEEVFNPKLLISSFVQKSLLCFKQHKTINELNQKIDSFTK